MKKKIGLNGFGRFGLHLLKYWLDRMCESNFEISYINDDSLNINQLIHLIKKDKYINFSRYKLKNQNNKIIFIDPEGNILATTDDINPFATIEINLEFARQSKVTYPRYVPE